jgi:hypothetical protein
MKAILNIGLNNNPLSQEQILAKLKEDYTIDAYKFAIGKYEDELEPTLVVHIKNPYARTSHFIKKIEELATILTQNCIAVSTDQFDLLVYAQNYNGQQYKFNNQYFIR